MDQTAQVVTPGELITTDPGFMRYLTLHQLKIFVLIVLVATGLIHRVLDCTLQLRV